MGKECTGKSGKVAVLSGWMRETMKSTGGKARGRLLRETEQVRNTERWVVIVNMIVREGLAEKAS